MQLPRTRGTCTERRKAKNAVDAIRGLKDSGQSIRDTLMVTYAKLGRGPTHMEMDRYGIPEQDDPRINPEAENNPHLQKARAGGMGEDELTDEDKLIKYILQLLENRQIAQATKAEAIHNAHDPYKTLPANADRIGVGGE